MSDRTLRLDAHRIAEARRTIRSRIQTASERIKELTQAMPVLIGALENLTADVQLAYENKERITALLDSLVDEKSDIIERIRREVEQGPHGEQYMILSERYQRYRDLGNSTIDSLRMLQRFLEVFRKPMDEQTEQAYVNNAVINVVEPILYKFVFSLLSNSTSIFIPFSL